MWLHASLVGIEHPSDGTVIRLTNQTVTGCPGYSSVSLPDTTIAWTKSAPASGSATYCGNGWFVALPPTSSAFSNVFGGGALIPISGDIGGASLSWSGSVYSSDSSCGAVSLRVAA